MIRLRSNGARLRARLSSVGRKQLPFAAARALTWTAKSAEKAVAVRLARVLDRPKPFTLRAPGSQSARKSKLRARVFLKRGRGKGRAAATYLAALDTGGARRAKGFERAMIAGGWMRPGERAVPGRAIKLDQHGNIPKRTIAKLIEQLQQGGGARAGAARGRKAARVFVPEAGSGLARGVWRRSAAGLDPLIIFVTGGARYRPTIRFDQTVISHARRVFGDNMVKSFRQAMETAR